MAGVGTAGVPTGRVSDLRCSLPASPAVLRTGRGPGLLLLFVCPLGSPCHCFAVVFVGASVWGEHVFFSSYISRPRRAYPALMETPLALTRWPLPACDWSWPMS